MNYDVVFHVDEMSKWSLTLKNVSNLLQQVDKEKTRIEILANSEAVKGYMLLDNIFETDIRQLHAQGVVFVACNNALKALAIDPIELLPFIKVVPAGVLELIERQSEGYAYIKP